MMRRLIVILLIILTAYTFGHGADVPQEYQVKTKYMLNMPLFTEQQAQKNSLKTYTICLIGDTPLESVLIPSQGKRINDRTLIVRKIDTVSQLDGCQMLFIASSERFRLQTLLPEARSRGILTISDMRDFTKQGGIVNLLSVNNRITFDLNLSAAGKASISFSSHLLKLANDITN